MLAVSTQSFVDEGTFKKSFFNTFHIASHVSRTPFEAIGFPILKLNEIDCCHSPAAKYLKDKSKRHVSGITFLNLHDFLMWHN